jgi:hypothetical protein
VVGLATGIYGAAKLGAKAITELPKLAALAKKVKLKPGDIKAPRAAATNTSSGGASGFARTPSQALDEPHGQSSGKTSPVSTNKTVFSGHGGYESGAGITVVPEGASLTVYSKFGSTITDRLGNVIETGGDLSKVYSRTYGPGDRLPNYTLYPPEGLSVKGNPMTVTDPTRVSDLLKPGIGECHWAACTHNLRAPNANLMFDTTGIADKQAKQWLTIYSGE